MAKAQQSVIKLLFFTAVKVCANDLLGFAKKQLKLLMVVGCPATLKGRDQKDFRRLSAIPRKKRDSKEPLDPSSRFINDELM